MKPIKFSDGKIKLWEGKNPNLIGVTLSKETSENEKILIWEAINAILTLKYGEGISNKRDAWQKIFLYALMFLKVMLPPPTSIDRLS